ncbi:hypothetical protein [uncultured Methanobrevibacter sp.]|uniref:hypothetical protein n=1 Tax=uncultured Methanobrevibacter sp. TaxID=253161 RepID=UPI0025D0CC44|nr:hypothetical protein [uncultured Methanobrevibacter sp.]
MKIESIKTIENGFMTQSFAFGGEDGAENFDDSIKYRSSIQNFLIDTGDDVILVDTGVPETMPIMSLMIQLLYIWEINSHHI